MRIDDQNKQADQAGIAVQNLGDYTGWKPGIKPLPFPAFDLHYAETRSIDLFQDFGNIAIAAYRGAVYKGQHRHNAGPKSALYKERPPPSNAFIGRQGDLSRLWTSLRPQPLPTRRRVAVVHGPDGIGKSRLAAHFSELHKGDFCSTWLVHGKDKNSVLASLAALASSVPTDEATSTLGNDAQSKRATVEGQASMVLEWLSREENSQWLLVFDDVVADSDPPVQSDSRDAFRIGDFFPQSDHGSILVTTTEPDMDDVGTAHALSTLSPQESLKLFALGIESPAGDGLAGHVEDPARKLLVHQLDGLPLALTQAASYIRQTGQSISSYLQLFQDTRQTLRETTEHECDSTVVTCALSFRQIQQSDPLAAKLLLLLSCYNNAGIPTGLLEYGRDNPPLAEWLPSSPPSLGGLFVKELCTLSDFSLITPLDNNSGTYSMYPVVKRWCRENIDAKEAEELNTVALILLGTATAEALGTESSPAGWDRQSLLPHADEMRRILQNNGGLVATSEQSLLAIRNMGSLYKEQGCLAHAEDMYLCALSRAQEFFGPSHHFTRQINKDLRRLRFMKGPLWKRFGSSRSANAILVIFEVCIALVEYSVLIATFFLTVLSILFAPFL
ncbi:P-loop containing nucleoside triphosphate hydrolase protein [Aspergillus pseudoustus]|uniref:P-loop containing nucleoside triphosphate hydrolase protein n=1 Tax=Aspergillus pseudoustus TaxID=1810923 RepID=A0ABR4JIE5_9EURO